jgi:hypothetical protein
MQGLELLLLQIKATPRSVLKQGETLICGNGVPPLDSRVCERPTNAVGGEREREAERDMHRETERREPYIMRPCSVRG